MSKGRPPALRANSVFATTGFTSSTVACAWTSTTRTRRPPTCTSRRVTGPAVGGTCSRPCPPRRPCASASGKLRPIANPAAAPVTVLIKNLRLGISLTSFPQQVQGVLFVFAEVFDKFRIRHQDEMHGNGLPRLGISLRVIDLDV